MALDKRLENLDQTIELQERGREIANAKMEAALGTELAVQRFQADVRKNQSEKLIIKQEIIQVENRINFLAGRFPEPVDRQMTANRYSTSGINLVWPSHVPGAESLRDRGQRLVVI